VFDELMRPQQRDNVMVIMAGGAGKRLLPRTESCPKPLLPVGGKPMLDHIIERAKAEGIGRIVLAVHYLGHMIEAHCGDGRKWGIEITYLREEAPLGTAGALRLLDPPPASAFLVTNGDVLTDIRYGDVLDFHARHGANATMAVRMYEWQNPFGVVHTEGVDIVGFEEKPVVRSHINAGVYVLQPDALEMLTPGEPCDMPTLFERLQGRQSRTIVYPVHEPWLDIGRADDLARAQGRAD
ncbi:MAG: sugar phosphate nucleotidyltransferase, partial [Acidobacteriota bacterium]